MNENDKKCLVKCSLFKRCVMENAWCEIGITLLRIFAGLSLAFAHGIHKIPPPEQFVEMIEGMGFPLPFLFSWCAGLAEFLGGLLLAFGLLTRPAALFILFTMGVAGFIAHSTDPYEVKELAFTYGFIALMFLMIGSGRFGLDRFLQPASKEKD